MKNRSKIWVIIVIAISITGIAFASNAADNWVLWEKNDWIAVYNTGVNGDVIWTNLGAVPQLETCEAWKENVIKFTKTNKEKENKKGTGWRKHEVKREGDVVYVTYSRNSKNGGKKEWFSDYFTYSCLSGTLDPREEKKSWELIK
jgi:hypothetical protein